MEPHGILTVPGEQGSPSCFADRPSYHADGNRGHVRLTPASLFHVEGLRWAPIPNPAAPHACALGLEGEARPVPPAPPSCQSPGSCVLLQVAEPPSSSSGPCLWGEGDREAPRWPVRLGSQTEATLSTLSTIKERQVSHGLAHM